MRIIGNLLWLIFGGLCSAIEYFIGSVVLMCTIIGIPFGLQTLKLGVLNLWPFGAEIRDLPHAGGILSVIMNVLWIFTGGICIFLTHIFFGILLGITIVGIPFARQHFKLARLGLMPFGKEVKLDI